MVGVGALAGIHPSRVGSLVWASSFRGCLTPKCSKPLGPLLIAPSPDQGPSGFALKMGMGQKRKEQAEDTHFTSVP